MRDTDGMQRMTEEEVQEENLGRGTERAFTTLREFDAFFGIPDKLDNEKLLKSLKNFSNSSSITITPFLQKCPWLYTRIPNMIWVTLGLEFKTYRRLILEDKKIYKSLSSTELLQLIIIDDKECRRLAANLASYQRGRFNISKLLYSNDSDTLFKGPFRYLGVRELWYLRYAVPFEAYLQLQDDLEYAVFSPIRDLLQHHFQAMETTDLKALQKYPPVEVDSKDEDPFIKNCLEQELERREKALNETREQRFQRIREAIRRKQTQQGKGWSRVILVPTAPQRESRIFWGIRILRAKWKALPWKWKILAGGIVALCVVAIVAAAVVCPPSLAITVPLVGKVGVSTLIMIGAGSVAGTTILGHGIHTARQSVSNQKRKPVKPKEPAIVEYLRKKYPENPDQSAQSPEKPIPPLKLNVENAELKYRRLTKETPNFEEAINGLNKTLEEAKDKIYSDREQDEKAIPSFNNVFAERQRREKQEYDSSSETEDTESTQKRFG